MNQCATLARRHLDSRFVVVPSMSVWVVQSGPSKLCSALVEAQDTSKGWSDTKFATRAM